MSTAIRMVMVTVRKEHESDAMPTHGDVAAFVDHRMAGEWSRTGWTVEGVAQAHLDVDTLHDLIAQAGLTGEQTVELMGKITATSISRAFEGFAAKAADAAS